MTISEVQTTEINTVNTVEAERESAIDPRSEEVAEVVTELEDLQSPVNEDDAQITEDAINAREVETEMVVRGRSPVRRVATRSRSAARGPSGNGRSRKVVTKSD